MTANSNEKKRISRKETRQNLKTSQNKGKRRKGKKKRESYSFLVVLKYGGTFLAALKYGGTFSAVPGTKYGGKFLAVMEYGGTDFGGSRYCEIWR